jgi:hypothetical protein
MPTAAVVDVESEDLNLWNPPPLPEETFQEIVKAFVTFNATLDDKVQSLQVEADFVSGFDGHGRLVHALSLEATRALRKVAAGGEIWIESSCLARLRAAIVKAHADSAVNDD